MKINKLEELYLRELRDLYGSEKQLANWLPKILEQADLIELRQALSNHGNEIRGQLTRLEKAFQIRGEKPSVREGKALEGILREADEDIADAGNPHIRDAVIVAAIQQIKHFEIAAYGTLHAYATHLDYGEDARLLQATLQEERATDRKLTEIALHYLKMETARM
jgi:ferritin-like metal-binding protein YciE